MHPNLTAHHSSHINLSPSAQSRNPDDYRSSAIAQRAHALIESFYVSKRFKAIVDSLTDSLSHSCMHLTHEFIIATSNLAR